MGLRERIKNRKPKSMGMDIDEYLSSEKGKRYTTFLKICERLQKSVDLSEIRCNTYAIVFEQIEKNNLDISDLVPKSQYAQFKKDMIESKVQACPSLGKAPDKIYDFNKVEDRLEYLKLHEGARF